MTAKDQARSTITQLVGNYRAERAFFTACAGTYKETQARTDFITPLLIGLGWNVANVNPTVPQDQRDVVEEASVDVGEKFNKRPDYTVRAARQKKFFVEAKKPSVDIKVDKEAAFQTRRYGYSSSLPISILTNFEDLIVFDCIPPAAEEDAALTAAIYHFTFEEFITRFDELYDLLSRESVYSGSFDKRFNVQPHYRGTNQFDESFLKQVKNWRLLIAKDLFAKNPGFDAELLSYVTQQAITRLIFLRFCEDRDIEKYDSLRDTAGRTSTEHFEELLHKADEKYNSGLFDVSGDPQIDLSFQEQTLNQILADLYYPRSRYSFAVIEPEILGEVYEVLLSETLVIRPNGALQVVEKPEIAIAGGICTTPQYIVKAIIEKTIGPLIAGKAAPELVNLTIADIACGSGIFLLAAFDAVAGAYRDYYVAHERVTALGSKIFEAGSNIFHLTLSEKRRIAEAHIFGVDVDPQAVEVAKFSLLLKILEQETSTSIEAYSLATGQPALPTLEENIKHGNSLVTKAGLDHVAGAKAPNYYPKIAPFEWDSEFPDVFAHGGFSAIVGNPPYVRIQNLNEYLPKQELKVYENPAVGFKSAAEGNYDKYALFIERAAQLLRASGILGYIVPNKFATLKAGAGTRTILTSALNLREFVNFGALQVFGSKRSTYSCLLIAEKATKTEARYEKVEDMTRWRYGTPGAISNVPLDSISAEPWPFASAEVTAIFRKIASKHPQPLGNLADISVGAQTSADKIYMIRPDLTGRYAKFTDVDGKQWQIEKGILKPCLWDAPVTPFGSIQSNAQIIWPYTIIDDEARLIPELSFKRKYPKAWAYLSAHKRKLSARDIGGGGVTKWYQYGRAQSLTKFHKPKLVVGVLALEPRYGFDSNGVVVTGGGNGPYYMLRAKSTNGLSLEFFAAILHHPVAETAVRLRTSVFGGGYYSHGKQFLIELHVPNPDLTTPAGRLQHDTIQKAVRELNGAVDAANRPLAPHLKRLLEIKQATLRSRVEKLVSDLYELSDGEVTTLKAVSPP